MGLLYLRQYVFSKRRKLMKVMRLKPEVSAEPEGNDPYLVEGTRWTTLT